MCGLYRRLTFRDYNCKRAMGACVAGNKEEEKTTTRI